MQKIELVILLGAIVLSGCDSTRSTPAQSKVAALEALHNDRIKRSESSVSPLFVEPDGSIRADGIWIPELDDQAHALVFPEQTTIVCNKGTGDCLEMKVIFVAVGDIVSVKGPEETIWPIKSWDKDHLFAEYGPWLRFNSGPEKCQKHVLSIVFASGAVTTSDIPTHGPGCDAFKETNSYHLSGGVYNIDTSPGNDAIKGKTIHR